MSHSPYSPSAHPSARSDRCVRRSGAWPPLPGVVRGISGGRGRGARRPRAGKPAVEGRVLCVPRGRHDRWGLAAPRVPVLDIMRMSRTHSESRRAPAHGRLGRMPRSGRVGTGATAAARDPAPARGTRAPARAARCAPGAAWGGGVERHGVSAPAGGGARGLWRWMAGMVSQRCECASSHYMTNCVTYIYRTTIKKKQNQKPRRQH